MFCVVAVLLITPAYQERATSPSSVSSVRPVSSRGPLTFMA